MGRPRKNETGDTIEQNIPSPGAVKDELAALISKNLNKEFKDEDQIAWFLDEPEEAPTVVTDWISTGSSLLDIAISNKPNAGLPVGKIVEFLGLEGTGKSLLAAHVLAETQKKGGFAVYIDTESSVSPEFLQAIGVDISQMLYIQLDTIEKIFQAMENIITSVRNSNRDRLVSIVVDSLAGASTDVEMEADYSKDGYATTKAILLSKALRKITNLIAKQKVLVVFTNQLRMKMQAMAFADPYTTSGGKAMGFHASVRLKMHSVGKIKDKNDVVIGNKMKVEVIKNRIGPPFRKAEFEMYYDSGLDNYSGWINVLKEHKVINQSGPTYSFELPGKETEKFMAKDFREILESRPEVHDYLYNQLCELLIMKYKKPGEIRIDDELLVDEKDTSGLEL